METTHSRTVWIATLLVIAGMILGYSLYMQQHDGVFAAQEECPYHQKCTGGDCNGPCPGCQKGATS